MTKAKKVRVRKLTVQPRVTVFQVPPEEEEVIEQPRSIATEEQYTKPFFKANMRTELQKFGYKQEARQLLLGEDSDLEDPEKKMEIYGLDLSVSEDKALHAVQKLLDKTNYKGNIPGEERQITAYKWQGYLPRLSITYSDYYEAYGLKPAGDGKYHGAQAQDALSALRSLSKARKIFYKKDKWTGSGKNRRELSDIIRVTAPLITILEGFKDLEADEAETVLSGGDLPQKRQTRLLIEASPLLVDEIDTFFLMKPSALHDEIQEIYPGKRISRTVSLFIEWLLTKNKKNYQASKATLTRTLRLDSLAKQRKTSLLNKKIQEALEVALELHYLLAYEETSTGLIKLTLNPERCKRIGIAKKTKKTQEAG